MGKIYKPALIRGCTILLLILGELITSSLYADNTTTGTITTAGTGSCTFSLNTSGTNNSVNSLSFTWTNFPAVYANWILEFGYTADGTNLSEFGSDNFSETGYWYQIYWVEEPAPSGSTVINGPLPSLGGTGSFYMQLFDSFGGTNYYTSVPMLLPVSQLGDSFNFSLPATCSISVSSGSGGSAAANPAVGFSGSATTLTATPSPGYRFSSWTVNSAEGGVLLYAGSNPAVFNFAGANASVTANFLLNPTINVLDGLGGSITPTATSGAPGSTVTLTATPDAGCVFSQWTVIDSGGGVISSTTANPATFTIGSSNATVGAHFKFSNTNFAVVNASVGADSCLPPWSATFALTTQFDLFTNSTTIYEISCTSVTPPSGWCGGNPYFATPALVVNIFDSSTGAAVNYGSLGSWTGRTGGQVTGSVPTSDGAFIHFGWQNPNNYYGLGYGGWYGTNGAWELPPAPIGTYNLQFGSDGNLTGTTNTIMVNSTVGGTAAASPSSGVSGASTTLTAAPSSGYIFSSWTVTDSGGGTISSTNTNTTVFTFGPTNASVSAIFVLDQLYALTLDFGPGGTASASIYAGYTYDSATLVATPSPQYAFSSWTVNSAGGGFISSTTDSTAVFTFGTANASITANFVPHVEKMGDQGFTFLSDDICDPLQCSGEPVDTGNGSHFINLSLLKVHGAQDLDFVIDYNSIAHANDRLGPGWSHNFEASLKPQANGAIQVVWNAKRTNVFSPTSTNANVLTCADLPVVYDTLTINANGTFSLKEPSQRHYEFDALGRLQQVVNPHGQIIQLVYQGTSTYPTQIVESVSGKSLNLIYNNNLLAQVSDNLGRTIAFSYDSTNLLTQFVKTLGGTTQTTTFTYDSLGHILTEINPDGNWVFTDSYDSLGRVSTQQDANGNTTTFLYDETQPNRITTTVIDRAGATNIYVHDTNYLVLSITDGLGNTTTYGNDIFGNKLVVTNALAQIQRFAYDSYGNMISATDASGETTTSGYDSRNNLLFLTNAVGSIAAFTYDTTNNLLSSLDFATNLVMMAYDANSQLTQTVSARGGKTTFMHTAGLLTSITDAATNTTRMAYDSVGRLIVVTNADGFISTNGYDLNDNLATNSDPLGDTWQYTYDSAGSKTSQIDPLGHTTYYYYDGNENLFAIVNPEYMEEDFGYDPDDRLNYVWDFNGNVTSMTYDAAGHLCEVTNALSEITSFQYDAVGNLLATVDALGVTNEITTYDVRNQPVVTQDALGNQNKMAYDALQRLVRTVDALNRTNNLGYDSLSRLTKSTDPMTLLTTQQFDSDGNRVGITNPKSAQFGFQYDLANRLTNSVSALGRQSGYALNGRNLVTQVAQPSGAQTFLSYDAADRLTNSQDSAGTINYTYDKRGRVLTITENGVTITRKYDDLDRLTNYTDVFGHVLKYAYDAVGNLTNLTYPDGKHVGYEYDAANHLTNVTDWNGRKTRYYYDADNRLTNITYPNGSATFRIYDAAGRVIQQLDADGSTNIYQVNFAYDAAGQIIAETNQPAASPCLPTPVGMVFDADNEVTAYAGQTVVNDLNGNMISGPQTDGTFGTFTYDARNRLTGAGGLTYDYDPAGYRVAITNNGNVTQFVVNPNAALSQVLLRVQNGVTNYYVYGTGLLYEVTQTSTTNILVHHYDYRGSTVALTDSTGNVTDRVSYSPYGAITARSGTTDTPFLFNGSYGVQTDANDLLFMGAKFYNTTICRFVNQDPLGLWGGPNWYAYANGNPINNLDPFGLFNPLTVLQGALTIAGGVLQTAGGILLARLAIVNPIFVVPAVAVLYSGTTTTELGFTTLVNGFVTQPSQRNTIPQSTLELYGSMTGNPNIQAIGSIADTLSSVFDPAHWATVISLVGFGVAPPDFNPHYWPFIPSTANPEHQNSPSPQRRCQ